MTISVGIDLNTHTCWSCGTVYATEARFDREKRENGGNWFCPNGHSTVYSKSEVAKLREALERAQRAAIDERARTEAAQRQASALKGQVTKARNRATAGVCIIDGCRRHFTNLERHMATAHKTAVPD